MGNSRFDAMVISTKKPTSTPEVEGIAPGKSGQVIQALTGGGFVHMHRDKKLRAGDEQEQFNQHLKSGGWLVITGDGSPGTTSVEGEYFVSDADINPQDTVKLDIECTAKDYVDLVMSSNVLKPGDHLNILLYVCYGGKKLGSQASFAEQLAQEFLKYDISSRIIASVERVGRIGGFTDLLDIKDEVLEFRGNGEDIRIFEAKPNQGIKKSSPEQALFITKYNIQFYDPVYIDLYKYYKTVSEKLNPGMTLEDFNKTREQAETALKNQTPPRDFLIRASSTVEGAAVLCYLDTHGNVIHEICQHPLILVEKLKLLIHLQQPDRSSYPKITCFLDFDGTLTCEDGRTTIKSSLYRSLLIDPHESYATAEFRKDSVTILKEGFEGPANQSMRLTQDGKAFLRRMLNFNAEIVIISKNRLIYIKAVLAAEGLSKEERDKIKIYGIKELETIGNKKVIVNKHISQSPVKNEIIVVCDDSKEEFDRMVEGSAKHVSPDNLVSYNHPTGKFDWEVISHKVLKKQMHLHRKQLKDIKAHVIPTVSEPATTSSSSSSSSTTSRHEEYKSTGLFKNKKDTKAQSESSSHPNTPPGLGKREK